MRFEYDMIVIGGGAAGLTAAGMSAVLGARTALVEAGRLGGDCTWHGCVPSKSLLKAAAVAHEMRTADRFGLAPADGPHDFSRVMERVRRIRGEIYADADAPPNMERLGVQVIRGRARFLDAQAVEIAENGLRRRLSSRWFVIATGSSPVLPEITGIDPAKRTDAAWGAVVRDEIRLLTNESIFELNELPPKLLIIGAGPAGIEMSQAFARLGSQVTVAEKSERILEHDDPELARMLQQNLEREGIRFQLSATAGSIHAEEFDAALAAVGRRPNTENLGLREAGVKVNASGIIVDRRCRTSARHIYACGDVIGGPYFTHFAEHSAKVAVTNAILPFPSRANLSMPWCTFTDPELAHAGATERELRERGVSYKVHRLPAAKIDRARTESEPEGVIKVLATGAGRILGASILASRAGEMIGEFVLAIANGIRLDRISATVHPYPTWALGDRQAADLFVQSRLTPRIGAWLRLLRRLRGDGRGIEELSASAFKR